MKTIGFTGMIVDKICGFGKERENPQKICIDISLQTDFKDLAETDDLSLGIDFRTVYALVITGIEGKIYTLEKAAFSIWKQLKSLKNVDKVKVTVKKVNPPFHNKIENSWATIEE
jgi:FolB domain-containing protein